MTAPQPPADPAPPPQPVAEPPKPTPPAPKPADADGKVPEGPHGYPEGVQVAEMTDRQAAAYYRHKARREEDARKAAQQERDALKPEAEQYRNLLATTESEHEQALRKVKEETTASVKADAAVALAGQRLHGLLMARGKTEDEADAIVEDLNLSKYVKDGKPDREGLRAAAERLAPKVEPAPAPRVDLGQGPRGSSAAVGVDAGRQMFADRKKSRPATTT